jgi:hypothetical protein
MNEGRTEKCFRQVEHIRGHWWHRYSIAVNQVMVATVKLSKWWLQPLLDLLFCVCVLWIVAYPFVLFLLVIVLPVLLRYTDSDYPFGIFWPWCCLSCGFWLPLWYLLAMVLSVLRLLITPLVSFDHGAVCPSSSDYIRQHHGQKIPKG